jgi:hypothetical protein
MTSANTRSLVALLTVFAGLSACTAQEIQLDALEADLEQALAAGDHAAVLELGSIYLGHEIDADEIAPFSATSVEGYISGSFAPAETVDGNGEPIIELVGRMISQDLESRHHMRGQRIAPEGEQVNGEMLARTISQTDQTEGVLSADFRTSPAGAEGLFRGAWQNEDGSTQIYVRGHWGEDSSGEGRFFGSYETLLPPVWGEGLRVRVHVDGVSEIMVNPNSLTIHHFTGAAPGQLGVLADATSAEPRPTIINGERWLPSWPAEGENPDCNCDSDQFHAPETTLIPESADYQLRTLQARGGMDARTVPSAENDWTVIIRLDDSKYEGAGWYEFELIYPTI